MSAELPRMLRTDARENRERIVRAARELFAERGIDVTMRQIARRAAVGPATLYRRFPTRSVLLDSAFADEMRECRAIVERGAARTDAWHGFCDIVEQLTMLNVRNQGFVEAFMSANPATDVLAEHRDDLLHMLADLMRRAQGDGGLRADARVDDIVIVLLAARGLAAGAPNRRDTRARRFAAIALAGLAAG
jgi:AcrR family transcriptional regulator